MHELTHFLLTNLSLHWADILKWIAGGGGIWLLTQVTKNLRNWENAGTIQRFALLASFLGTASDWFLTNYGSSFAHANNPFLLFPAATAGLFTLATFIHHTPLKQLVTFFGTTVAPYFQAVKTLKEAKTASQPTQPVPVDSFQ